MFNSRKNYDNNNIKIYTIELIVNNITYDVIVPSQKRYQ